MKISRIKVRNFRSIKEAEITPSSFNVFVGQNNHGKTNFFEAIDWFYKGKGDLDRIRFGRSGDEEISVEIEFSEIQDGITKMKNKKNQTTVSNLLSGKETVRVRRTSTSPKKRPFFDEADGEWKDTGTGFDAAFNDFLPTLEYVSTEIQPMDMLKYGKGTPVANMLGGVLSVILSKDPDYSRFMDDFNKLFADPASQMRVELDKLSGQVKIYLEKQFPDCEKVVFEVAPPIFEDLLKKFETSIDDGVYTSADEKGDGMQRALMLAIIQAYADYRRENEETSKYFLFLIDEGELHLHPTAQRKLKNALLELSHGGDQVLINTHSSVLVSDDSEGQNLFKVEKLSGQTNVVQIEKEEKAHVVYELLGGSPADLLLPRNFLIVEGKSEYEFVNRVISRFYSDKPEIQIVYAEGNHESQKQSMNGINKVFVPLFSSPVYKDKLVIFCDTPHKDKMAGFESFKAAYSYLETNGQLFVSPQQALEAYYPAPWQKTETEIQALGGSGKVSLAREAGEGITQEQFEGEMPMMLQALNICWGNAY